MRFGLCLHAGAVARRALRLHETDSRALALGLRAGAEIVVVEMVGQRGTAPTATSETLAAGAHRAVRVVDPALDRANAQTTGFVLAAALERLEVDLVLFGGDADPEAVGDVPACIAHHMSALYFTDVLDLTSVAQLPTPPPDTDSPPPSPGIEITLSAGAWIRRLRVPLNAVVGLAPGPAAALPSPGAAPVVGAVSGETVPHAGIEILTLVDLDIDPGVVHSHHDGRGFIDAAPRPLVTLQSAAAIAALLRG